MSFEASKKAANARTLIGHQRLNATDRNTSVPDAEYNSGVMAGLGRLPAV